MLTAAALHHAAPDPAEALAAATIAHIEADRWLANYARTSVRDRSARGRGRWWLEAIPFTKLDGHDPATQLRAAALVAEHYERARD